MSSTDNTALGSGILPWTRSCFVCGEDNPRGFHLKSALEDGRVVLMYTTQKSDLGWSNIVHGGIAMTLLDEVMTWAAIIATRRPCVAAEVTVRLKKPIKTGQTLRVESKVPAARSRLVLTKGIILDEREQVLVSAEGKYVPMAREDIPVLKNDFVLSPDALALKQLLGKEILQ